MNLARFSTVAATLKLDNVKAFRINGAYIASSIICDER